MALETLGQPTILIGTTEFDAKSRAELQTWGLPDTHFICVPHGYQYLDARHFTEVVDQVVQQIVSLVGPQA